TAAAALAPWPDRRYVRASAPARTGRCAFVPSPQSRSNPFWTLVAPAIFVVLWSTGFIAAKTGLPFAEPLTFRIVPFVPVIGLMTGVAIAPHAPWPRGAAEFGHVAVVGVLMHGACLGGVFMAIHLGLPAGIVALIVGMQPILTAFAVGPLL